MLWSKHSAWAKIPFLVWITYKRRDWCTKWPSSIGSHDVATNKGPRVVRTPNARIINFRSFRNWRGTNTKFTESFHQSINIHICNILYIRCKCRISIPIRLGNAGKIAKPARKRIGNFIEIRGILPGKRMGRRICIE